MTPEIDSIFDKSRKAMNGAIEHYEKELSKIRAGKASTNILDDVKVDYYGTPTPIGQVANISTPDARTINIKPWERKIIGDIEKAIFAANIGLTPQNDGENIRLNFPPLTEERRKDLVKQAKAEAEHARVAIRNTRKHSNDHIKAEGKNGVSEDMIKTSEEELDKVTKSFIEKIDKIIAIKEKEILTV
jgi:ribosome recycling factor